TFCFASIAGYAHGPNRDASTPACDCSAACAGWLLSTADGGVGAAGPARRSVRIRTRRFGDGAVGADSTGAAVSQREGGRTLEHQIYLPGRCDVAGLRLFYVFLLGS